MFAESKLIIESENWPSWHPPPSVRVRGADTDNYRHNKHVIKTETSVIWFSDWFEFMTLLQLKMMESLE